jgi:hypothetical protein
VHFGEEFGKGGRFDTTKVFSFSLGNEVVTDNLHILHILAIVNDTLYIGVLRVQLQLLLQKL